MTRQDAAGRDHGGRIDAAVARFGGARGDWMDLSTGIAPEPWPVGDVPAGAWAALPDASATQAACDAARAFWRVPASAAVLAAPGASALIARIPALAPPGRVWIPRPTYNEHAAAFAAHGWRVESAPGARPDAAVAVHPNNPDGRLWDAPPEAALCVIDESFCDTAPGASLIAHAASPGTLILKSFGKFWGLAGLRLGFAIGDPGLIAQLAGLLGPWPVSGPALDVAARALADLAWADAARARYAAGAARLDALMGVAGTCGTSLYRLVDVGDAAAFGARMARHRILVRTFPWSGRLVRIGLPPADGWDRVAAALASTR